MKKLMLFLLLFTGTIGVKAQYVDPYAAANQLLNSAAQYMQNMQFDFSGILNGTQQVPQQSAPQSNGQTSKTPHQCSTCKGTGQMEKYDAVRGNNPQAFPSYWCNTCHKKVLGGHYHVQCTTCGGTGQVYY